MTALPVDRGELCGGEYVRRSTGSARVFRGASSLEVRRPEGWFAGVSEDGPVVPRRPLREWVQVEGTRTTYALPSLVAKPGPWDNGAAELLLAYATAPPLDRREAVRLDFRGVAYFAYSAFDARWAIDAPGDLVVPGPFGLSVTDQSEFRTRFLPHLGSAHTDHLFTDATRELLRHFHVAFDDFGSYDILAVGCIVRPFTYPPVDAEEGTGGSDGFDEALLRAALELEDPPPIAIELV